MRNVLLTAGFLLALPFTVSVASAAFPANYEPSDMGDFVSSSIHAPLYSNN